MDLGSGATGGRIGRADPPREGLPGDQARQEAEYVNFVETHAGWACSVVLVP